MTSLSFSAKLGSEPCDRPITAGCRKNMVPQPKLRSELRPDDSQIDPTRTLEQYILSGFPPDLALDLILNELVVRAAEATRASAAALALARGDEMVCRAATGHIAPALGVPLNPRDGLSGACVQTHQPQLSVDTEFDPRVDSEVSRRLGIRSILIVPVFEATARATNLDETSIGPGRENGSQFSGVLEVFSTSAAAFSDTHQKLLEGFADECARVRRAAIEFRQRKAPILFVPPTPGPVQVQPVSMPGSSSDTGLAFAPGLIQGVKPGSEPEPEPEPELVPASASSVLTDSNYAPVRRLPYEGWAIVLGALAIFATVAVSFLIGSRVGWLGSDARHTQISQPTTSAPQAAGACAGIGGPGCPSEHDAATTAAAGHRLHSASSKQSTEKTRAQKSANSSEDELVVYDKGKVIFRLKSDPKKADAAKGEQKTEEKAQPNSIRQESDSSVGATPATNIASSNVSLSPSEAEALLLSRIEPQYPAEALAENRAGNVVLKVQVSRDGTVSATHALRGDPVLAAAAAEAVRNWRYQPYLSHGQPSPFQTDVTLNFMPSN